MSFPKLLRKLFTANGGGDKIREELLPDTVAKKADLDAVQAVAQQLLQKAVLITGNQSIAGQKTFNEVLRTAAILSSGAISASGTVTATKFRGDNGNNTNVDFLIKGIDGGGMYIPGDLATNGKWRPLIVGNVVNTVDIYTDHAMFAGAFKATSDIRHKTDIKPIAPDLSSLKAYTYTLKDDGQKHTGLIAQEVEKVIPHAVTETDDGTKVLDYNAVVAALVSEVNALKSEVLGLLEEVRHLKSKVL